MPSSRFLRLPEVKLEVGLSRATIYRLIARSEFPAQHQLSVRCVGWYAAEIEAWKSTRQGRGGMAK